MTTIADWNLTPPPDEPLSVCSVCGAFDDGNPCDDCEYGRQLAEDLEMLVGEWPETAVERFAAEGR